MKNKSWFKKNLGDAMLASITLEKLEKSFRKEREKDERANQMAMFSRHESEGRLHCELVVYFSPASGSIAIRLGATPCAPPIVNDLSLCVGDSVFCAVLFTD